MYIFLRKLYFFIIFVYKNRPARYNESMDIVTLTLNPCLDRTAWVGDFGLPPTREEWQTGGKGVNVARVLSALGAEALAVCPLGGETGERFARWRGRRAYMCCPCPFPPPRA